MAEAVAGPSSAPDDVDSSSSSSTSSAAIEDEQQLCGGCNYSIRSFYLQLGMDMSLYIKMSQDHGLIKK